MSARLRIVFLCLLLCPLVGAPSAAWAQAWGLPQLMEAMAQVPAHQSRFTEKKTLALLKAPLESSGTLAYRRPAFVEKHVLAPQDETLSVDGDELRWQNNTSGKKRTLRLQSNLPLWAFVESIRATLAGDLKTLQRFYEVRLDGTPARWVLTLTPSDDTMRRTLQSMRIEGAANRMLVVDVLETGGDRSVMQIQHE